MGASAAIDHRPQDHHVCKRRRSQQPSSEATEGLSDEVSLGVTNLVTFYEKGGEFGLFTLLNMRYDCDFWEMQMAIILIQSDISLVSLA